MPLLFAQVTDSPCLRTGGPLPRGSAPPLRTRIGSSLSSPATASQADPGWRQAGPEAGCAVHSPGPARAVAATYAAHGYALQVERDAVAPSCEPGRRSSRRCCSSIVWTRTAVRNSCGTGRQGSRPARPATRPVPVTFHVAEELGAPLDVIVVRKLSVPFEPQFGSVTRCWQSAAHSACPARSPPARSRRSPSLRSPPLRRASQVQLTGYA
jgi:hypothetical protein